MDQLKAAPWDRFAGWDRWPARILLLVVAALLVLAAIAPLSASLDGKPSEVPSLIGDGAPNGQTESERDDDLAFYDRVIERVEHGENYYDFIVEEQRARDYPVRPGLAVRLPTLAWIHASLGEPAMIALAIALLFACIWAWWNRLGEEPGGVRFRLLGTALMAMGGSLGLNRSFFVLHELWAGMLIALAFGLHRPGRWGAALFVAALALALRELVLPFVLLMAAMAAWRKDWREATAWIMLVAVFAAIMVWHLSLIAVQEVPSDPVGPDWLVLRGLSGWLGNIVLSSNLRLLPHELASPVVILMALGWAGWKSSAGTTGTFLYLGYGLAFMLAGRANNFYWGAVVAPAMFIGLAFLPMALPSLVRAALGKA
ncbi:MAG: hypothetical protein CL956_04555 [Erythrobacteraceae bacterium]|nr:hypothetical protein [Sphingomonadaceae bacterium]MBG75061.1 hypothetical protein [Erythrobacteraceae bacterium]